MAVKVASLVFLVAAVGAWWSVQDASEVRTAGSAPPEAYFDLHGGTPEAFPARRLAIGFLELDQPLQRAIDVFGPPPSTMPDIAGQAHTWELAGAELTVSAWDEGDAEISGLYLKVPPGSPARFAIHGGAVIGASTLQEIVDGWGPRYTAATSSFDDFAVRYVDCVGPFPVVVKFDQDATGTERDAEVPKSPRWDERVTSMLVAYADEPPNSAGCGDDGR